MNRHPDKCKHPFDTQKGRPPYWLRSDAADLIAHWKLIQAHERVHVRKLDRRGVDFAQSIAAHSDPRMTQTYVSGEGRVRL